MDKRLAGVYRVNLPIHVQSPAIQSLQKNTWLALHIDSVLLDFSFQFELSSVSLILKSMFWHKHKTSAVFIATEVQLGEIYNENF